MQFRWHTMTDKIGAAWAASINVDERDSHEFIRLGIIDGDGLIGEIIEAANKIISTRDMVGVWEIGSLQHTEAIERNEEAWIAFWDVLKRLEQLGNE